MVTAGQYRLGGFDLTLNDPRTIANVQYILQYFAGNQSGYPNLNINMYNQRRKELRQKRAGSRKYITLLRPQSLLLK